MYASEDEWRSDAEYLIELVMDAPWRFGDWCLAADDLGLVDERTFYLKSDSRFEGTELAHYAYVSERIEVARRRPLPWSYHDAVARFPAAVQESLLDLCESEEWTLQELKRAARESQR